MFASRSRWTIAGPATWICSAVNTTGGAIMSDFDCLHFGDSSDVGGDV